MCSTAACRRLDRQLPRHVKDLPYRREMLEGASSSHIVRWPGDTVCAVRSDGQDTYDREYDPGRQRLAPLAIPLVLPESPEGQTAWGPT